MSFGLAVSPTTVFEHWQFDPVSAAGLAMESFVAVAYIVGWRMVRRRRPWSGWRVLSFVAGLLLIALVLQSGFSTYDDTVFSVHMTQHLVLMMAAPPLLAMGAPITLLLAILGPAGRRRVRGVLRDPSMQLIEGRKAAILLPLDYYGSMFLYMLTPLYRESEVNPGFHEFVHVYFLACGVFLWFPLIRMDPTRWRPAYRLQLLTISVGVPLFVLLGFLVAVEGRFVSPEHSVHQIRGGALMIGVLGAVLSLSGLVVIALRQRRRESRIRKAHAATVGRSVRTALLVSAD
jgi:putative copper resistance protein D